MGQMIGLLLCTTYAFADSPNVESWSDPKMPVANGLVAWYDASTIANAYQAMKKPSLNDGDPIDVWPDASGRKRNVHQSVAAAKPKYQPTGGFHAVRFDGKDDHLTATKLGLSMKDATVFIVVAPYSCPEWFSGFLSASLEGQNDYVVGFNIDQLIGAPQ